MFLLSKGYLFQIVQLLIPYMHCSYLFIFIRHKQRTGYLFAEQVVTSLYILQTNIDRWDDLCILPMYRMKYARHVACSALFCCHCIISSKKMGVVYLLTFVRVAATNPAPVSVQKNMSEIGQ